MTVGPDGVTQAIRGLHVIGEKVGADSTVDRFRPAAGLRGNIVEDPVWKHHVGSLMAVHDRPFKTQGLLRSGWEPGDALEERFEV